MSTKDIQQEVTNNIISLLEKVDLDQYEPPFKQLASQGLPRNPTTDKSYQGINILTLWFDQHKREYPTNEWATYKQWQAIGAQVKRKQKGSRVVFFKTLHTMTTDEHGEEQEDTYPMMRAYSVFNAQQVENYRPEPYEEDKVDLVERSRLIDTFAANSGVPIQYEEGRALYSISKDYINMPKTDLFNNTSSASATENYYSTLLHELTHATGAEHRLDRFKDTVIRDRSDYGFEELVAEIGSAFLCAQFNLKQQARSDHAVYIKHWLQALQNDVKHIFKAAALASKATTYLNGLQPSQDDGPSVHS